MKILLRAGLAALVLVLVLATRSYSGATQVSSWTVAGIENEEGAYSGTAELVLDQLDVTLTVNATTATGKSLSWTGEGKLDAGGISLTVDAGGSFPGAAAKAKVLAAYVVNDDGSLSGYWQVQGSPVGPNANMTAKIRSGGTETLTFASGTPLPSAPTPGAPAPKLPADALKVPTVTQPDEYGCGASSLQSVLYYYRVSDGDLHDLYKPLGTSNSNGTEPPPIVAFARNVGLTANFVKGTSVGLTDLQSSLANRDPVMLVIQAWKGTTTPWATDIDDAHWVVLVGMDTTYA